MESALERIAENQLTRNPFLDLIDCGISFLPEELLKLKWLKSINLAKNQIIDVSPLQELTQLIELDLRDNQITDISPLQGLTQLINLDLSRNQITDIFPLQGLTQLINLDLSNNRIINVPPLQGLTQLTKLRLNFNQITDISPLQGLTQLMELRLDFNQITDISPLKRLSGLTLLGLGSNNFSTVKDIRRIVKLPHLEYLVLAGNPIKEIPKELYTGPITDFFLSRNCVINLRNYFEDTDKSNIINNEIKLVLIGNGRVGKTSLYKRLVHDIFDLNEKSTHAILLDEWTLPLSNSAKAQSTGSLKVIDDIIINIWDFGGQDIYHATHRLFMQTEALFLLVWDLESEKQANTTDTTPAGEKVQYPNYPLSYWLTYAKTLGNSSPVIVVQTKINAPGHRKKLPQNSDVLLEKYPIASFEHVDSATGAGIVGLKEAINESALEMLIKNRSLLPQNWYNVRMSIKALAKEKRQISVAHFQQLCLEQEVEAASQATLLTYLHQTGILFYRYGLFGNQIILDQKWAIDAVYTLFDRQKVFYKLIKKGRDGKFTLDDLEEVWSGYILEEKQLFIDFMKSCEICYEVTDGHNSQLSPQERVYLAPALLSDQKPERVTGIWQNKQGLYLQYQHEFLHFGIMQSFMVRMGKLKSVTVYDIWKNGIWIALENAEALIEVIPATKTIQICIEKQSQKKLLEKIRNEFLAIQQNELGVQEWVSIDGNNYVELLKLKQYLGKNHQKITSREENEFNINEFRVFLQLDENTTFKEGKSVSRDESDMNTKNDYDIAISFSGEDRQFAEALASALKAKNVRVFYDNYEKSILWGKNLYTHLTEVYQNRARYCIMLLSQHYATKLWTNHEREAAQARAFKENVEYILPIRLDKTEIPGVLPTIGYLSVPPETIETIVQVTLLKLHQ